MSTPCPFRISLRDQMKLDCNETFMAMRQQLHRQDCGMEEPAFCSAHRHAYDSTDQEAFRLHRDIIHTLLVPLFLINHQAERIAARALSSQKGAEPERAFRGDARSAFAWLHCVLVEEHDWYLTARCPACIVLHVLHSEPTIRFVAVAAILSPGFDCWLSALETAVREDPFWGDAFWPDIGDRASKLAEAVQQLVHQCHDLCATGVTPVAKSPSTPTCTIAIKPSSFAQKQVRLSREEQRYRSSLVWKAWNCSREMELGSTTTRRRSLTS